MMGTPRPPMPLPWTFADNLLAPVAGSDGGRVLAHIRVYSDRWAGAWVIVGIPFGQSADLRALMPAIRPIVERRLMCDPAMWVSYEPDEPEPFRTYDGADDTEGRVLPAFEMDRPPRETTATGTRLLRCGPVVDVWDGEAYTVAGLRRRPVATG